MHGIDSCTELQAMEKKEHLYKVLVIGDQGTGKTSIIRRYTQNHFSLHYKATMGVDMQLKVLEWDENRTVKLHLWDIQGQELFRSMTRVYYKEAVGCLVVFDVGRPSTFEAVEKWKADLDSKVQLADGSPVPCVLLANKCDQSNQVVIDSRMIAEYCQQQGFLGWFETSAKEDINIREAANFLVTTILENEDDTILPTKNEANQTVNLGLDSPIEADKAGKSKCCS